MAYRRRYGRRVRRYGKGKALSTRNIYGRKSASAQAHQIAALRRRINKVSARCKPELKVFESSPETTKFTSEASGTWVTKKEVLSTFTQGTGDSQYVGDHVRSIRLQIPIHAEFSLYGYDGDTQQMDSLGASVRVVVFQSKSRTNETSGSIAPYVIISNAASSGSGYELLASAPLVRGVTERFKILADKKYNLTNFKNQLNTRISVRPDNVRFGPETGYYNKIFVFFYVANLHWTSLSKYEYVNITHQFKFTYTDA